MLYRQRRILVDNWLNTFMFISLLIVFLIQTLSMIFSTSYNATTVLALIFRFVLLSSITLSNCVVILCEVLKPYWSGQIWAIVRIISVISHSKALDIMFNREMGQTWMELKTYFPRTMMTTTSFQV